MRLKKKLYLLNLFSAIVPIIVISLATYFLFSSKLESQEDEKIHSIGLSIEKNIYEKIQEARLALEILEVDINKEKIQEVKNIFSGTSEIEEGISKEERFKFLKYRISLVPKSQKGIRVLAYGTEDKELITSQKVENDGFSSDYDPTTRPWYTGAIKSKKFYVSDIYPSALDQKPILTVSKKIVNNGIIEGVLVAVLDLSTTISLLSSYKSAKNEPFLILNRNTKMFLGEKEDIKFLRSNELLNFDTLFEDDTDDHLIIDEVLYHIHHLSAINSILITYIPEKELYNSLTHIKTIAIILILITLLLIHILLLIFGRLFDKSLDRLSYILHSISRGNYSKNIEQLTSIISDKSELSIIKDAIKNMHFEIVKRENELKYMSEIDQLTQIYNRRAFMKFLETEIERSKRSNCQFILIMFDLDRFKALNDNFGHLFGDEVLREISQIIKKTLRKTDYLGRYGGEEFMVLLTDTTIDEGVGVAQKLRKIIESLPWKNDVKVTISLGVVANIENDSIDKIIERADQLLYKAKENGRNKVEY